MQQHPGMESCERGSHTVWDCKYHLVWVTKYRYEIFGGEAGLRCRALLREIARTRETQVHAGSINRDHVHREYRALRKRYWGKHLWASICGLAATGWHEAGTWPMGYGKNTSRTRCRPRPTMTFRWHGAPNGGPIRLPAVTRSYRL